VNIFKSLLVIVVFASSLTTFTAKAGLINFGNADRYTMAVGGVAGSLTLGSEADIHGNVGSSWYIAMSPLTQVHGDACASAINFGPGAVIDGISGITSACSDYSSLSNSILLASEQAAALNGENKGDITSNTVLYASYQDAYAVGKLTLATGEILTVVGGINDSVVINVADIASIGSGAAIKLEGGILASNVVFNFLATAFASDFSFGGAQISGTYISNTRSFQLGDGAILNDARFYSNHSIVANVQSVKYSPSVEVPEPITLLLMLAGVFVLLMRTNLKHK
jgi:hypothetical protein